MRLARRQALVGLGALALARPAWARTEPDLALYQAIREEGLKRGQAMTYAASLVDGVGARLMGSPGMRRAYDWSLAQLREMGLSDPRLEPIGPFGLSWRQVRAWARPTALDGAPLVAQAAPWSVATNGVIEGEVAAVPLATDEDLQRAKGKLVGKVVMLSPPPADSLEAGPAFVRYTDEEVVRGDAAEAVRAYYRTVTERRARQGEEGLFKARRNAFLAAEGVLAVVVSGGGNRPGVMTVDGGELGGRPWLAAERPVFPVLYLSSERYGQCWRLAQAGAVRLQMEIATEEGDPAEPGYNVVAELPGTDPRLRAKIVLTGAHLDSWAAGAGAADNGAGVAATLEAIRILRALNVKPRRTIRVVLYGGEEQGLYGSEAYARSRLGHIPRATAPEQMALAVEGRRTKVGPLRKGPEYEDFSVAFNLDGGSGRIRGVFTGGNPALAALYRDWIGPLKDLGVLAVYDSPHWPADQSTFTEIGLPGISFLQDPLDYDSRAHHTNLDTLERLSPDDLAQAATVLAIFLINSADVETRI